MIDKLSWMIVRLLGLIIVNICLLVMSFYHPNPTKREELYHFTLLISGVYSGIMLFHSRSPNDIPNVMRQPLLVQGRLILALFALSFFRDLLKMVYP